MPINQSINQSINPSTVQTRLEVGGAEAALQALVVQHLHLEAEVPLPQL
jgi:hypothetical protein